MGQLKRVLGFLGLLALLTISVAPVFAQHRGGCNNSYCAYVQCNDTTWGFGYGQEFGWNAQMYPGPCQQICEDGLCGTMASMAFADPHGEGVVLVEDVKQGEVEALRNAFSSLRPVSTSEPTLASLRTELIKRFGRSHRVEVLTGDQFNERVKKTASKGCRASKS